MALTLPEGLALGAATGRPASRNRAAATGWAGTRSATVPSPALTSSDRGVSARRGNTKVRAPGQNFRASLRAASAEDGMALGFRQIGHMHDQGIETRPALGGEDAGHRLAVCGVRAQAINRLGRESDQRAVAQQLRRAADGGGIGGRDLVRQTVHARF